MGTEPSRFADLTGKALARPELMRRLFGTQALKRWSEAVGELLASKSAPEKVEKGVLWVIVDTSAWAQEMRMHSSEILAKLNEISPEAFTSLRIRVGKIDRGGGEESDAPLVPIEPDELEIDASSEIMRRALGRLKAASRLQEP
jgi:hypothetical protein